MKNIKVKYQSKVMFLQNFVNYIQSIDSDEKSTIELEFKLLIDSRLNASYYIKSKLNKCMPGQLKLTVINMIKKMAPGITAEISQSINFIDTKPNIMYIKQLNYIDGVQDKINKKYYSKESLIPSFYILNPNEVAIPYKVSINKETIRTVDTDIFDLVRFRLRYSFILPGPLSNWRIDLTFIKENTDNSITTLKNIRDKLFSKTFNIFSDELDWDYPDKIEMELEYIGDLKTFNISEFNNFNELAIFTIPQAIVNKLKTHTECICEIAAILKPNAINNFISGKFGLKQLGSNPIELTKSIFINDMVQDIEKYIVTEKIDGLRSMLLIYPQSKLCYVINNECLVVKEISIDTTNCLSNQSSISCIILDTEAVNHINENGTTEMRYYIFDIIKLEYQNGFEKNIKINKLPIDQRINEINIFLSTCNLLIDGCKFLYTKHFIKLTNEYGTQIQDFYSSMSNLHYDIDGLIFIPTHNDIHYKWKPVNTIDFIAKKCPLNMLGISPYTIVEGKTLYLLFSGIPTSEFHKTGINLFKSYDQLFTNIFVNKYRKITDKYIPVQFSPSDDTYAYLFWNENSELDSSIVELTYNIELKEWLLIKVRTDRNSDITRKTYYGNYIKVAESIWMSYKNPLSMSIMCNPLDNNQYFKKTKANNSYAAMRKFNNYVKLNLIKINCNQINLNWVIDLASGNGQDLFKYTECEFKNILLTDIHQDSLSEVINRKYIHLNKHETKSQNPSRIFVKRLDLSNKSADILESIFKANFGIPADGVQFIVCNLAIHYFIANKTNSQNFVNILNKLLAFNGVFICTSFNGKKVFDLLNNYADDNGVWNKYDGSGTLIHSIKKKYTSTEFTGTSQKIDVLLPFSDGQYYTENLINYDLLNEQLNKKKIKLINHGSFDTFLDDFDANKNHFSKQLRTIDKEYISLYHFYVYKKLK